MSEHKLFGAYCKVHEQPVVACLAAAERRADEAEQQRHSAQSDARHWKAKSDRLREELTATTLRASEAESNLELAARESHDLEGKLAAAQEEIARLKGTLSNSRVVETSIGGAYSTEDGRQFWIDGPVAREMTTRVMAALSLATAAPSPEICGFTSYVTVPPGITKPTSRCQNVMPCKDHPTERSLT